MSEVVTILFPSDPGSERLRELQGDLRVLEGFAGAGTEQTRSAGIASGTGGGSSASSSKPAASAIARRYGCGARSEA